MGIEIVVSVDERHLGRLDAVAEALERMGMDVEHRMASIGAISGTVDAAVVDKIREVDGVEAVEVAREFQLPPPDSDVQ